MDWISTNWSSKLPMDGMGQVIVALLLLLIAPQPGLLNNDDSDESPEAVAIDMRSRMQWKICKRSSNLAAESVERNPGKSLRPS